MRFSGTIPAKLDAKGRVFFPSAFRKQLPVADVEFVLKKDIYQPCLVVYPRENWDREVDRLSRQLNRWNPKEAMLFRQYLADTELFVLDGNGRFLVSRRMMEQAGISHDVVFIGVDDRVELWDKELVGRQFLSAEDFAAGMEAAMGAVAFQNG